VFGLVAQLPAPHPQQPPPTKMLPWLHVRILTLGLLWLFLFAAFASAAERMARRKIKGSRPPLEPVQDEAVGELKVEVTHRPETCERKTAAGSAVKVHYMGTLADGTPFDSSYNREPLTFTLGTGQVIRGWDNGLLGMCEGEVRKLIIPPQLAYGDAGYPPAIPPKATLTFVRWRKVNRG